MLVDIRLIDSPKCQDHVDKFNNDFVRPYFINHINSYLESIIMEDQKKQVNASRIIHAQHYNEQSGQFGIGQMSGGEIKDQAKVAGVINEAEQRNLAEVAKEIQQLLDQLSETYPTTTTSEKYEVAAKAIKTIEDDSLLTSKIIRVVKATLFEALKQAVNHPLVNIVMAGIEEALDKN
jgi:metal-dependent amidase/aminoacylase/carboxypeptidase family protein